MHTAMHTGRIELCRPRFLVSAVRCAPSCDGAHAGAARRDCAFRVAWTINPHMVVGSADPERATEQHLRFVRLLERLGAQVTTLPFVHGAFDSVFAKDNAVVVGDADGVRALLGRARRDERRAERHGRARALASLGVAIDPGGAEPLEGGDVQLLADGSALLGHGFRSSSSAAVPLSRFLGAPVVPLTLVDPRLYHLDMAVSVLRDGTALVCAEALAPASVDALARHPQVRDVVAVPLAEALAFGVNLVEVGDAVVTGADCPRIAEALRARGRTVHVTPLGEFQRAGGSAACLVAPVYRPRARTHSATAAIRSTAA